MSNPERSLRRFLRANALFSGVTAVSFALPSRTLPALIGRPSSELITLGLALFGFALFVGWLSFRQSLARTWTRRLVALVVVLDFLWVVQTVVQVSGLASYTVAGRWLFGGLALVVLGLAAGQGYSLWHLHAQASPSTPSSFTTTDT